MFYWICRGVFCVSQFFIFLKSGVVQCVSMQDDSVCSSGGAHTRLYPRTQQQRRCAEVPFSSSLHISHSFWWTVCVWVAWSASRCLGATPLIRQAEGKLRVFLLRRPPSLLEAGVKAQWLLTDWLTDISPAQLYSAGSGLLIVPTFKRGHAVCKCLSFIFSQVNLWLRAWSRVLLSMPEL